MGYLERFLDQDNKKRPPKALRGELTKPTKPDAGPQALMEELTKPTKPPAAGPWDPQAAGALLSAALNRIKESCPAGCVMDSIALREGIEAADAAFEAGDGERFRSLLAALEEIAREHVASWRRNRGRHKTARKIWSEILACHLWIVDEPGQVPSGRKPDETIYHAGEIAALKVLHDAGKLSPDQLRTLHEIKKLWPGAHVQADEKTEERR